MRCAMLAVLAAAVGVAARGAAPARAQEPYHPFQQDVEYRIEASLDDATGVLTGRARLRYTNRAPGTVERLYFHQYLNAFRPGSAWARHDLLSGIDTFQRLGASDHGFERLTSFTVAGAPLEPVYPYAPDSTVFYVQLARPLGTGETVEARIDWQARLATVPRRQGREGRHHNWAHWYPRIAFFGRDGWEYRVHIRPGELNGAFAGYDVTLELAADRVLGATGVPAAGDPGWSSAAVPGSDPPDYRRDHYGRPAADPLGLLPPRAKADRKQVRWLAVDVHNFAWSTSPRYVYRGGSWRDVPIHLLWEPSSRGWDDDRILHEQREALDWLAELFGEYAWPQITVTDRIERGATEFPMLYMTSGGAVVHETMHMVAHGVLANNEWREGWLDEGLASFLSNWFRERRGEDPESVWGRTRERVARLEAAGRSEPVAQPGAAFSSYDMYQLMTYSKASLVLRMLRDMLGETTFRDGLRRYYESFRFRQVTGQDFRHAMEAASGKDLSWFFRQWLETTRTLDYRIGDVTLSGDAGTHTLEVEVIRAGDAWMPVVVQVDGQRLTLESSDRIQRPRFSLPARPAFIVLDPDGSLLDADRSSNAVRVYPRP